MDESPELSVLLHELGGMLSSIQGFAHIAAENPGHPERERFIKLAASEARRAAQVVKDIHLVRSFDHGRVDASPPPVDLASLVDVPGASGIAVVAEPAKVSGLLERCVAAAIAPPEVFATAGRAEVRLALAPASDLVRRVEGLDAPYPDMVAYAILRRLLRLWGGDLTLATSGDRTVAALTFARA